MRTAARTACAIATAVLTGALLGPAGAALAAAPPRAATAAAVSLSVPGPVSPSPSPSASVPVPVPVPERYAGTPVLIGTGIVAVLRYGAEGPEAWIRAVPADWKPGDTYMTRVLTRLDDRHRSGSAGGLQLELVKGGAVRARTLVVTGNGRTAFYPLPLGRAGDCRSGPVSISIGGGMTARLTTSPQGPRAELLDAAGGGSREILTRTGPSLPANAGIVARILNPDSAGPVLEWRTEGGGAPYGHAVFPGLPAGCGYDCAPQAPTSRAQPDPDPSAAPFAEPSGAPERRTAVQGSVRTTGPTGTTGTTVHTAFLRTSALPRGVVAADAAGGAPEAGDPTPALAGAGLGAAVAGLGAFAVFRGRRTARR
ncbi:hypothetical protein [Streptomyces sp. NBC_00096]|uniref:hypothetical protein n=1 Tax=Streptomyces sp. NBC_00096 TaxID=2975650 RepID=UPI0032529540